MSSRKLRREAARLIREHGFGRLYQGKAKNVRKGLYSSYLKMIIHKLQFKPGMLVNDCDGYNHNLVKWLVGKRRAHHGHGSYLDVAQFEKEDGNRSCGCPWSPEKAWTVEEIRAFHRLEADDIESLKQGGWYTERTEALQRALEAGQPICDDQGRPLNLEETS